MTERSDSVILGILVNLVHFSHSFILFNISKALSSSIITRRTSNFSFAPRRIAHFGAFRYRREIDDRGSGALARFELARGSGGPAAADAAGRLVDLGHPIVVDYLIDRARQDVESSPERAWYYGSTMA